MASGSGKQDDARLAGFLNLLDSLRDAAGVSRGDGISACGNVQSDAVDRSVRFGDQLPHESLEVVEGKQASYEPA